MSIPLIFIGAAAVRELTELVRDINAAGQGQWDMRGVLDDRPDLVGQRVGGLPVMGALDRAGDHPDAQFVYAIGSHKSRMTRRQILDRVGLPDQRYATLVHPGAKVYSSASVGIGSIIHFGTVIGNDTRMGRFVIAIWNSVIGADAVVGDGVVVASNVTLNQWVRLGAHCFIGAAAIIADQVTIGPGAMVGTGTMVMRDVEPGAFVLEHRA